MFSYSQEIVGYKVSLQLVFFNCLITTKMKITIWNSTDEIVVNSILVASSFFIHLYALFLTSAIYDFQDEKPEEEKSHFDVLIKDLMRTVFWTVYMIGITQFISLFMPPMNNDIVYSLTYLRIVVFHFNVASILVTVYIHNVFIFQPDDIEGIMVTSLRRKSMVSNFLLTFVLILLSIAVPVQTEPLIFQWLNKGKANYER